MDTPNLGTGQKRDFFEVLVLLLFIVPQMIISLFTFEAQTPRSSILPYSLIFNDLAYVSLIAFFLWRNDEPLTNIGWQFDGMIKEAALGVGLFLPLMVCIRLIEKGFEYLGLASHMNHPPEFLTLNGPEETLLTIVLIIVVATTEETIFRGYLILRFSRLTGSPSASVIISSVLFSLGHGYEGLTTMLTIFISGTIVALIYVWRKSLVAPMVIHLLVDLYPLVLMPLVGVRWDTIVQQASAA